MLIAQISDMHVKPPGELLYKRIDTPGFLERAVAHVHALDPRPDVVLATGDLVDGGKPEEYALLRQLLAPLADAGLPHPRQSRCARRHARGLSRSRLPAAERLPAVRDRGPAGAPDRARHAGAGQGPRRAVRRAAGLAGGAARRKRPADGAVHASSAVRLRHRRLRRHAAERGRRAAGRDRPPPRQCRARDVRPRPSADPGALGRHHGLDRAQHGAPGDARSSRGDAAFDDDGAARHGASSVAAGHGSRDSHELHRNLRRARSRFERCNDGRPLPAQFAMEPRKLCSSGWARASSPARPTTIPAASPPIPRPAPRRASACCGPWC